MTLLGIARLLLDFVGVFALLLAAWAIGGAYIVGYRARHDRLKREARS